MNKDKYFEQQCRKAFEDRSEKPPKSVWEKIEAQLDEQQDQTVVVLPWWNSLGWVAGVAAAVGLLLVAGVAWQHFENTAQKEAQNTATQKFAPNVSKKSTHSRTENATQMAQIAAVAPQRAALKTTDSAPFKEKIAVLPAPGQPQKQAGKSTERLANRAKKSRYFPVVASIMPEISAPQSVILTDNTFASFPTSSTPSASPSKGSYAPELTPKIQINILTIKGLQHLSNLAARKPWVSYSASSSVAQPKRSAKVYWAALSLLPTRFNSGLQIPPSYYSLASTNFVNPAPTNNPKEQSYVGASVAVQSQVGIGLGKRWSLETGVGYLRGKSVYEANTYIDHQTGLVSNSLETAIANSPQVRNGAVDASKNLAGLSISSPTRGVAPLAQQAVDNHYDYLQIPLQVGYAVVQNRRRLSFWVLGGFANTILLQNQFENGQKEVVHFGARKGAFRTFAVAASTGARLQYQFAARWSATMTGNYQHSLSATTYSEAILAARPWWWGVGCGLQYGF